MHAFFQNMGGSSTDLNISYGSTAPTDTSKLWVNCAEPEKVLMDNSFGINSGEFHFDTTKPNFYSFYIHNGYVYYIRSQDPRTGVDLRKYNISTQVDTLIRGVTTSNPVPNSNNVSVVHGVYNNCIYFLFNHYATYSSGPRACLRLVSYNLSSESVTFLLDRSYNTFPEYSLFSDNLNSYIIGNKIYVTMQYFSSSSSSSDVNLYYIDLDGTNSYIPQYVNTGSYKNLWACNGNDLYITKYKYTRPNYYLSVARYNIITATLTNLVNDLSSVVAYGSRGLYVNNKIVSFRSDATSGSTTHRLYAHAFDLNSQTMTQIGVSQPTTGSFLGVPQLYNEQIYLRYSSSIFNYSIPLQNNYLAINFNTQNNRWQVLEDEDELSIKVNPVSVYRGNSSNQGIKQNAYLHINGSWQSI